MKRAVFNKLILLFISAVKSLFFIGFVMVLSFLPGVWVEILNLIVSIPRPGPEVIKLFSCSAQLRLKFTLLINVEMPTIVDRL